ncbi:unnamed protein product [Diabrotica balteata]|uniref:Uncharacterized protein n=1 Tax=Diabrotica balteata TaxID=107213 RepID=A0A9N9TDC1_DIABA|nr:unnamed protein product [Diabrotica balteata]
MSHFCSKPYVVVCDSHVLKVCRNINTICEIALKYCKDFGVHLRTDSAKWIEKCRAITGTTQDEVDAAAQGMFPEEFALKPNMEAVPERLKHYWPVKVVKPEELSQYIPCAKTARELGPDVPTNKKILEMTKCHYKINPEKYIIF